MFCQGLRSIFNKLIIRKEADMITVEDWNTYHRYNTKGGDWRDVREVLRYLENQPLGPFSMDFKVFCDLFMRYYNLNWRYLVYNEFSGCSRWYRDVVVVVDDGQHYYFSVSTKSLIRLHREGYLPSEAARFYYRAAEIAEDADAREAAQIEREWRNYAETGDPNITSHDIYKYDRE